MAGQTLTTTILINARADNTLNEVGNTLMELGALVNQASQEIINLGKDSVKVYRDYEKSMKDAEIALSTTYGIKSSELAGVMTELDEAATNWAANSIFHTNDVANAISEAAHAGWDLDQIMSGLPAAMQLAQAGGIDLSTAVDYVVKSTNAAGIEFDNLGHFIDLWTYASNSSASTIDEFGQAMLRMGNTMRFAANPEELMTLIAVTANAGAVGSQAGTLIRNSIMRLAAPTDKAAELMEQLGASTLETSEIMSDPELMAANERLAEYGFSMYDQNGQMKSVLDTYRDLYIALGEISGGYDKIAQNEDAIGILHGIFQNRSLTEALTLLQGAADSYDGLYEAMMGGDAEGYAEYAQETMWQTLDGRIEEFESKVENLKKTIGEELSGQLRSALEPLGELVDNIAGMDEGAFAAIVGGLEAIAVAGPGLMLAGGTLTAISKALSLISMGSVGPTVALAFALGTAVSAMERMQEVDFERQFGSLALDNSELVGFAQGIAEEFDAAYQNVDKAQGALDSILEKYQTATSDFKRELFTQAITGEKLTKESKDSMVNGANEIAESFTGSINANKDLVMESLLMTFGGQTDEPLFADLMSAIEASFEADIARAEQLSSDLRKALFSAFQDGTLSTDEVGDMQAILDAQADLLAQQEAENNYVQMKKLMRQAQTLGLDTIEGTASAVAELRQSKLESRYEEHDRAYHKAKTALEAQGAEDIDIKLAALAQEQRNEEAGWETQFNAELLSLYESGAQAGLAENWDKLGKVADMVVESGGIITPEAWEEYAAEGFFGANNMTDYVQSMVEALGGREALSKGAAYFDETGDAANAAKYRQLMAMYDIAGERNLNAEVGEVFGSGSDYAASAVSGIYDQLSSILSGYGYQETPEALADYMTQMPQVDWATYFGGAESAVYQALSSAAQAAGTDISGLISQAVSETPVTVPAEIELEETDLTQSADTEPITVDANANTDAAQGQIDALDGQDLMEYVDGDNSGLASSIDAQDGRTIITHVDGETSRLASAISSFGNRTVYVNVVGRKMGAFAEGGRTTSPAIFGEGSTPEWAIPEAHTERTAELLNAAREASGFTWSDLLARYGGLNANPVSEPSTIVYSPTINANDASGVDAILKEDKFRLERWFEERQMRERMEVYA